MKKMSIFVIIIILNIIISCTGKKSDETVNEIIDIPESKIILWNNVSHGMSIDDVKTLYPSSVIIKDKDDPENLITYRYDGIIIQNEDFQVDFYFVDQKLDSVSLFAKNEIPISKSDNIYPAIAKELNLKYGDIYEEKQELIRFLGTVYEIIWNSNDVIITLSYFRPQASFDPSMIEIVYTTGSNEKVDNL